MGRGDWVKDLEERWAPRYESNSWQSLPQSSLL